jgi:Holliday junction resolvase RusA-like endonuclease
MSHDVCERDCCKPALITLFVPGTAAPGGSKKGWQHPKTGRIIIVDDAKYNAEWKQRVKLYARLAYKGSPLTGALLAKVTFVMQRPKSHYGTGKNAHVLKATAPHYHTTRPDSTKLFRSTEDALTGIIWVDDGQVMQEVRKIYGDEPGVHITIEALE